MVKIYFNLCHYSIFYINFAVMLEIDSFSIIIAVTVVVIAIIGALINPFFRRIHFLSEEEEENINETSENETSNNDGNKGTKENIPITVLLTTHDNAPELKRNLTSILTQDYPDFQVVIVGEQCETETEDLLKRFSAEYPNLYYTLVPESSRYMSKKKLQITLGVKAAKSEWIILTEPTCKPDSDQWLKTMAQNFNDETHFVMGVTKYDEETKNYYQFDHIRNACYFLRRAQEKKPFGTNMNNICFRKTDFMNGGGFIGNLQFLRGEYHFLTNKYASEYNTVIELSKNSWLTEEEPTRKTWCTTNLIYQNTQKELDGCTGMRMLRMIDHLIPHMSTILILASIVYGALLRNWIILGAGAFAFLLLFFTRMGIAKSKMNKFEYEISAIKLPFYEWSIIWHNLINKVRYWKADKNNFTSHKL